MTFGIETSYTRVCSRIDHSVPRSSSVKMASILQVIPVHNNMNLQDFPWNCRYPKNNDWFFGNLKWYSKETDSALPRPVVICGPSGSGKSTLLSMLMADYKDCIEFSISHTTRSPRPGEKHGQHYYFVDKSEIEDAIARGEFLEYTEFSGNYYGTSKSEINRIQNKGKLCFLDLEINGVKNIRKTSLKPRFIFIKPPSLEVLEERLRGRNTETEESLRKRLNRAQEELAYGDTPGNFDYIIVNDDAEKACEQLKNYLLSDLEMVRQHSQ